MLIYDYVNTNTPFDGGGVAVAKKRYKNVFKRNRSHSKRSKVVKRGGRLPHKVIKVRKSRKSKKRAIKKLSAKNLKFLKKLGFRVNKL